jgi:hypothetical protein
MKPPRPREPTTRRSAAPRGRARRGRRRPAPTPPPPSAAARPRSATRLGNRARPPRASSRRPNSRHPLRLGHRGDSPLVVILGRTDESERRGGRTNLRLRPTRSYTTLWDVTAHSGAFKQTRALRSRTGRAAPCLPNAPAPRLPPHSRRCPSASRPEPPERGRWRCEAAAA